MNNTIKQLKQKFIKQKEIIVPLKEREKDKLIEVKFIYESGKMRYLQGKNLEKWKKAIRRIADLAFIHLRYMNIW